MYLNYICIFIPLLSIASVYGVEVKVKQGKIIGTIGATVFEGKYYFAFYGVPYAQPPVGELRFKDPKPVKKYKKPFDASVEYHGACAQAHILHKHGLYGFENCLNMNIYTPEIPTNRNEKLKPVVVWIHGYAFTSSFSHIHGADFFIDNGVIFISVTHRIGVFGFLKLNDADANSNMGLKDIVMALKWVRKNIKYFGGDKEKITVMGSGSAGTWFSLLLTTRFKKLFSKMILQSCVMFSPSLFQSDHVLERERLIKELKKFTNKDLLSASTEDIIKASQKIYTSKEVINFQRPVVPFTPIIDEKSNKSLLIINPRLFHKTIQNISIPILIGFNSLESIPEVIPFIHNPRYLKSFSLFKFMVPFMDGCKFNYTSKMYKRIGDMIKNKYFDGDLSEKSLQSFLKYTSDLIVYPVLKFIKTFLYSKDNKMYVYKFNYVGNFSAVRSTSMGGTNIRVKGAASGDEICYLLKCEPLWESYVNIIGKVNNRDRMFIKEIAALWSNFVKVGDPTPSSYLSNFTWSPMTLTEDNILILSSKRKLRRSKQEYKMFSFWEDIYTRYYSNENCMKNKHDEL